MRSVQDPGPGELTARAGIRNAALRLFAERGPDAVTIRQIADEAGVSAALVLHHFGSKAGLREAVDAAAAQMFDGLIDSLRDEEQATDLLGGGGSASIAEAFARAVPEGSPLPAYLRRLFLSGDPAGQRLFSQWYAATGHVVEQLTAAGIATPSDDPAARAAFLLVNDLALVLLRSQIAAAIGVDPLSPVGMARWATEATAVYTHGAFRPEVTE